MAPNSIGARSILFCLVLQILPAWAEGACERPIARLFAFENSVRIREAAVASQTPAQRDMGICVGDTVLVGERSRARLVILASGETFAIDQNSEFVVQRADSTGSLIQILRGALLFFTRGLRGLSIQTPFVNAAVEGTEFLVRVQDDRTRITVFEGSVRATNPQGTDLIRRNQFAEVLAGQAPVAQDIQINVRPRDAVQWALYYEPILPGDSLAQLEQVAPADRNAAFYVRRAGQLLAVGRADEAQGDITQAISLDANSGDAYALRTIIDVALNNTDDAVRDGREATARTPNAGSARMALSYALQSTFRLEAARDELLVAVQREPQNGRAWARLAEIRLSLGDLSRALEAARRAAALSPDLARPQTVLGFAALTQIKLSEARSSFEKAMALEPSDPLPRLGLGLAKIRGGNLAGGRQDLELAVALNPDGALLRSYLGKAYFEERRDALAAREFDVAKQLDPMDPTAWFYEAIRREALHEPVQALEDLSRSVELNDNRAVYRSRLLLDEDLAVRGARLGRIYRDLGFENQALLQGWQSLAVDPTNYSAHRLLADNYLVLPRHEIARDSELLQAQLLQPVNINPVQPRLASNGVGFLDDTGVSGVGFNEFTQLFETNQLRFVGDGVVGQQNTATSNLILSGVTNRLSYSVGQFHVNTDGIRQNDDLTQNIYSAFLQADVSPTDSAQIEVRWTDVDLGDRRLLFHPQDYFSDLRSKSDTSSVRLGGRHTLSPTSALIGSYVHRTLDSTFNVMGFGALTREVADFFEARYIGTWRAMNITAGIGSYWGDLHETLTFGGTQFPPDATEVRHTNGYLYSDLKLRKALAVSGGLSREDFKDGELTRDPWNPKFGFIWNVGSRTTVRGASFRTLKRTLISSQTVEPTQVAGFNQFFDDPNGTEAWRHGVAIDQSVNAATYLGGEMSMRRLRVPVFSGETRAVIDFHNEEQLGRLYVYRALTTWLTFGTDYRIERFIRDPLGISDDTARLLTHKLGAEGTAFLARGVFGRLRVTLVNQSGRFLDPDGTAAPGRDRFATLDISLGYHLPRRRGVLTIDARNLFDSKFLFQDAAPDRSQIVPQRLVTVRLTIVL